MNKPLTEGDLQQIALLGITPEQVEIQIENFRKGFPRAEICAPATIANGGILKLTDEEINHYEKVYGELSKGKKILKFVPASGAATRMFKDLYAFSASYIGEDYKIHNDFPSAKEFIEHIRTFAFFDQIEATMKAHSLDFGDYMDRGDFATIINMLLKEQYMGYGSLPKALLLFWVLLVFFWQ